MSLGYIGYARYKEEKRECLIYEYSGENWNTRCDEGDCLLYDGLFSIEKSVFNDENWGEAADQGRIKVLKECKNAFYKYVSNFDYIALVLISKIFSEYKDHGQIPEKVVFCQ